MSFAEAEAALRAGLYLAADVRTAIAEDFPDLDDFDAESLVELSEQLPAEQELDTDGPLKAALAYASDGLAVFPVHTVRDRLCSCGKAKCYEPGKHPRTRNGLSDASTDPAIVRAWWEKWPDANVAIRTGAESGIIALDVDPRHGGLVSLEALERRHGRLPATPRALTGSGGEHRYFRHPGVNVKNSAGAIGEGLDVRGDGGYAIVAPSLHESGNLYKWLRPLSDGLAEPPAWLLEHQAENRRNGSTPAIGDAIPEGHRNAELASIAGTMRRRGMSEAEILAALQVANRERCKPSLDDTEVAAIAASIAGYPPAVVAATPAPRPGNSTEVGDGEADRRLDDIGNASRLVDQHGETIRYVPAWKSWLIYDGHRWSEDEVLDHLRFATSTARSLIAEAAQEPDESRRKHLLRHAQLSAAEPRLRAMLTVASADRRVVLRPRDLDGDPYVLNTESGVVDLRTGELRPHRPEDHLSLLAGAAYDPKAVCPTWEAHVRLCLVTDEMQRFLQRLAGAAAVGTSREQKLPILYGAGANGKSVTRNAIAGALGDYAHQSSLDLLMATGRNAGQATPELADLRGRRLVTVSETPADGKLAAERVKSITGGEPITARRLHANPFTFDPSHSVWLLTNHLPRVPDDTQAIWRRLLIIEFGVTIPEADQDSDFGDKLAAERNGILRWIVDGAVTYLRDGLNPPACVLFATARYRDSEDTFSNFLAERCHTDPEASEAASDLRDAYNAWADQHGANAVSAPALAETLRRRGYERKRSKSGTRWNGLRLAREGTLDV